MNVTRKRAEESALCYICKTFRVVMDVVWKHCNRDGWILNFVGISNSILSHSSAQLQLESWKLSKLARVVTLIHTLKILSDSWNNFVIKRLEEHNTTQLTQFTQLKKATKLHPMQLMQLNAGHTTQHFCKVQQISLNSWKFLELTHIPRCPCFFGISIFGFAAFLRCSKQS